MISDKLYSNHTVLIPSKKGVGGRSGLMPQYTGLRVERVQDLAGTMRCVPGNDTLLSQCFSSGHT